MKKILFLSLLLISFLCSGQTISSTGQLNVPRWEHEAQLLYNGKVLAFGGDNGDFINTIVYKSAELYDPISQTWTYTGDMNKVRTSFASVTLNNGDVLAIGGNDGTIANPTASCEIYSVATGIWSYTDSLAYPSAYHQAIRLMNGNILAVAQGGCQIYDLATNTWEPASNPQYGGEFVLTMLSDGRILATGADDGSGPKKAVIYDPVLDVWTTVPNDMNGIRFHHSATLLPDGKVLIYGSTNSTDNITAEIFNPATNTFTPANNMLDIRANSPGILMDNGKVLSFGIGDFFSPSNTKCIQIFNPANGTWTTNSYTIIGTQAYTIHKLHNGKILVTGGSYTTGNGASRGCALIDQGISPCSLPDLSLLISGSSICYGNSSSILINTAEAGITYQAKINELSASVSSTGPGNISLSVPGMYLSEEKNVITVSATKTGCPVFILSDTAIILTNQIIPKPSITVTGTQIFCNGDSTLLNAPGGYASYFWSNGSSANSLKIKASGRYTVQVTDNSGCKSSKSDTVQITVKALPVVNAGVDETVCINKPAYSLSGNSPGGGIWSGSGISSSGTFDPVASGTGSHIMNYQVTQNGCLNTSHKTITVNPALTPSVTIAITSGTNPTTYGLPISFTATPSNGGSSPSFQWKINGGNTSGNSATFTSSNLINGDVIYCQMTSNAGCLSAASDTSNSIGIIINNLMVISTDPPANSINTPDSGNTKINFSHNLEPTSVSIATLYITGEMSGKRTVLSGGSFITNAPNQITYQPNVNFFPGEEVSVTAEIGIKSSNNLPMPKSFCYKYRVQSASNSLFYKYPVLIPVGDSPQRLVTLDADGDLDLDLVSVNSDQTISVRFNDGTGKFSGTSQLNGTLQSSLIHSGDWNNDGSIDIAITSYSNDVSFFKNNGSGNFQKNSSVYISNNPRGFFSADFDGDGDLDAAILNGLDTVYFLLNNGTGIFTASSKMLVGNSAYCISGSDFDNDADIDLIIGHSNNLTLLSNNGSGSFTIRSVTPMPAAVLRIGSQDLDKDLDLDLAIGLQSGNIQIRKNDGMGNFSVASTVSGTSRFSLMDLDGDQDLDIFYTDENSNRLYIQTNDGTGNFTAFTSLVTGNFPIDCCAGDFNNDGTLDLASCNTYSNDLSIFTNVTAPYIYSDVPTQLCKDNTFLVFVSTSVMNSGNSFSVELSDQNGSFASPLIIGSNTVSPIEAHIPVSIFGGTNYRIRITSSDPPLTGMIYEKNINIYDTCAEIISIAPFNYQNNLSPSVQTSIDFSDTISNSNNTIKVYGSMTGCRSIPSKGIFTGTNSDSIIFKTLSDFKPGEKISVIIPKQTIDENNHPLLKARQITFNVGTATAPAIFTLFDSLSVSSTPSSFYCGDLNNDGSVDLVIGSDSVYIRINNGSGKFNLHTSLWLSYSNAIVQGGDFDGDGDIDIAATAGNKIYILKNDGTANFSIYSSFDTKANILSMDVSDFDNDGDLDIVAIVWAGNKLFSFKNDGSGNFNKYLEFPTGNYTGAIDVGDIDNDGDMDIFVTSDNDMTSLRNDGYFNFTQEYFGVNMGGFPRSIMEDMNNDGELDIFTIDGDDARCHSGDGSGYFFNDGFAFANTHQTSFVERGDFDGDGNIDVIVINYQNNMSNVLEKEISFGLNDGTGLCTYHTGIKINASIAATADFDNDGDLDIVANLTSGSTKNVRIYLNDDTPTALSTPLDDKWLMIYPNPTEGILHLMFERVYEPAPTEIVLSDVLGRIIYVQKITLGASPKELQIDLSDLENGVYFIQVKCNDKQLTRKVVRN